MSTSLSENYFVQPVVFSNYILERKFKRIHSVLQRKSFCL